jgi:serine/threonine-protein kinase
MMDGIGEQLRTALGDAYRVERELGGGGMSRVFVAEDLALGRQVVVKVLPPETANVVDVDRFKREIQVAARLQQPFIVPLLTAGTSGGLLYYTMPMVEGESLQARLSRLKQLPVGHVVRILRDVLAALSYAHKHGIVHRDIKPANVLLSDERAMVSDFGIAKALGAATGGGSLTATGLAIGTPAYMAPEQAAGDATVDHRADLYAVGVMAYEMLAGVAPFPGASAALVMARQIREPAEPVTNHRPNVPPDLADLVHRLLEKMAADRPQSADEVLSALEEVAVNRSDTTPKRIPNTAATSDAIARLPRRWLTVGLLALSVFGVAVATYRARQPASIRNPLPPAAATASAESLSSLAVLPFVNESPDSALAYFADGMTDELITALSGVAGLSVMSRSSVFALKGTVLGPARIGDTLHVTYLLEGSVRRAGDRLRMTATLLRARDGTTRWSATFAGDLKDVFAVQDSIARAVVDSLRIRIGPEGIQRIVSRPTTSTEAYDLYLRALKLFNARRELETSAHLVQQALDQDSLFAAAHALLASDYLTLANDGAREDLWPLARAHATRAIALDSNSAEGHAALASVTMVVDHDWKEAMQHYERAIVLRPSYAQARDWHALLLAFRGHREEATLENAMARTNDPLSRIMVLHGAWIKVLGRQLDSAATLLSLAIAMSGDRDAFTRNYLGYVYTLQGRFRDGIAQRRRALALEGADTVDRTGLAMSLARAGQLAEAQRIATEMRAHAADDGQISMRGLALLELALGDTTGALRWLSQGANRHSLAILDVGVSPDFDGLRAQPTFKQILRTLRLAP